MGPNLHVQPGCSFQLFLTKVQENMTSQLKIIQGVTSKAKSLSKLHQATDELDFLVTFNRTITQAMARTMQDLSDGVFINMANLTLVDGTVTWTL